MKDGLGYTLYENEDDGYGYYQHSFQVDGRNIEGEPEQGLFTLDDLGRCRTKKEAENLVKRFKDKYDKIEVYDEYWAGELNNGYFLGNYVAKQTILTYVKGKQVDKCTMI